MSLPLLQTATVQKNFPWLTKTRNNAPAMPPHPLRHLRLLLSWIGVSGHYIFNTATDSVHSEVFHQMKMNISISLRMQESLERVPSSVLLAQLPPWPHLSSTLKQGTVRALAKEAES
jgi:hypothetical protein